MFWFCTLFINNEIFFGENYWNTFTSEYGTEDTGTFLRAAYVLYIYIYIYICFGVFVLVCFVLVCFVLVLIIAVVYQFVTSV
jgi:hypothetical protein